MIFTLASLSSGFVLRVCRFFLKIWRFETARFGQLRVLWMCPLCCVTLASWGEKGRAPPEGFDFPRETGCHSIRQNSRVEDSARSFWNVVAFQLLSSWDPS
jgi:hypothetical protein